MNKFIKTTLLISLFISSGLSSFAYADEEVFIDEPTNSVEIIETIEDIETTETIDPIETVEPIKQPALNEFPVNGWNTGFNFIAGGKTVTITYGNQTAYIKSGNSALQYYFDEKFVVSQNMVKLSSSQYNLIVDNIENAHSRRIRTGRTKYMPQRENGKIYSDEGLTKHMRNIPVGTNIKVINSVLDGKLKVLTPDGKEGFMDTRAVNIVDDSLPPNIREINFNTPYIILVSQDNQSMKVYMKDGSGNYNLVRQSKTSTGKPNTPTPNGIFTIKKRGAYFSTNSSGGRAYNYMEFRGNHLFHSVLYSSPNTLDQAAVRKLGSKDSAGCIRLPVEDSKWIYKFVSAGSLVIIDNVDRDINKIVSNKNL